MSLQTTININVDFYDKKYILINAKQYDSNSRWVAVTCYNQGDIMDISANKHTAYIRYRKADGYGVLNSCRINYKGEVLVELTEQMLAADGICYVDLIIVNKGSAIVNIDTGEIITVDDSAILSTMAFCINVYEASVDNSLIESSYEYNALNEALQKSEAEYTEVIRLSKSYAVGDAGGIRENEDSDNSKYYSQLASESANNASISETNALQSENNASNSEANALASENAAAVSEANALASETAASASENAAKEYEESSRNNMDAAINSANSASESANKASASASSASDSAASALLSATNALTSENNASASAENADISKTNATESANAARDSADIASSSATEAFSSAASAYESAAIATESEETIQEYVAAAEQSMNSAINSATSATESEKNAHDYYLQVEEITTGLSGAFLPMGTIEYEELLTLVENGDIRAGHLYNISDNFTTNEVFKKGAGIEYAAGTNVYYTSEGFLDCLTGTTVSGVKGEKETEYRKGNVNITVENIGAVSSDDVATVDEVISYLGI